MTKKVAALWILGTLLVLWIPANRQRLSRVALTGARTPVDRVNPLYARQWLLLRQAGTVIAPGASYTVTARDTDLEMLLFMLSYSALPDRVAYPTTYWGVRQQDGSRARFVVAYDCAHGESGLRVVRRFEEGCVMERPGASP